MTIRFINKMCMQKLFNKDNILNILFLIALAIFVYLGCWQLYRLDAKNKYISEVFKAISGQAKTIDDIDHKISLYDKIKVTGRFLDDKAIWLYRRHPAAKYEEGAYLAIPVEDRSGRVFLSLLGWVKNNDQLSILEEISKKKEVEISGILLFSEEQSMFIPKNDYMNKICFTLDIPEISAEMNIDLHEYFVAALSMHKIFKTKIYDITPDMMIKIRNDHLEYAATWFGLAAVLCYMYYYICSKRRKNEDN